MKRHAAAGGVGKTWFAINLGHELDLLSFRTLLMEGHTGLAKAGPLIDRPPMQ